MIDWLVFYAMSAEFQPYRGEIILKGIYFNTTSFYNQDKFCAFSKGSIAIESRWQYGTFCQTFSLKIWKSFKKRENLNFVWRKCRKPDYINFFSRCIMVNVRCHRWHPKFKDIYHRCHNHHKILYQTHKIIHRSKLFLNQHYFL